MTIHRSKRGRESFLAVLGLAVVAGIFVGLRLWHRSELPVTLRVMDRLVDHLAQERDRSPFAREVALEIGRAHV